MNIVTLFIIILGIAAAIGMYIIIKTLAEEYQNRNEHERKIQEEQVKAQQELFADEDPIDSIDAELEKEKNKNE